MSSPAEAIVIGRRYVVERYTGAKQGMIKASGTPKLCGCRWYEMVMLGILENIESVSVSLARGIFLLYNGAGGEEMQRK